MIELLLPYGFDTLEYLASVRLQIILWLRNTNTQAAGQNLEH
jgi:hypothetical protein